MLTPIEDIDPRVREAIDAATRVLHVTEGQIRGRCRNGSYVEARQIVMYVCKRTHRMTHESIGAALCRDHSTIVHGIRTLSRRMADDPTLRDLIAMVSGQLTPAPVPVKRPTLRSLAQCVGVSASTIAKFRAALAKRPALREAVLGGAA